MTKLQRILVPLDHSPGYEVIVDVAAAIARGAGATLTLLHVYEPPNAMIGVVPGATVGGETAAARDAGAALLLRAAERAGDLVVGRRLEQASPASHTIVHEAGTGKFDMIVMGTHARRGVARLVLGSTAEKVLREAPCPVTAVHLPQGS